MQAASPAPPAAQGQIAAPPAPIPAADIVKVGILLPLSGAQAPLGQAMLNAAQMAVFDGGGNNFELLPRDTGDSPAGAQAAFRDAASSGARLIVGPVFAAQAAAIKPAAAQAGINVLALTSDSSLAQPGLYVMGFSPGAQTRRIVAFAIARGSPRLAALIPAGAYGDIVSAALRETAARYGGAIVVAPRYNPGGETAALEAVAAERGQIDALLIAEGGESLQRIAALLPNYQLAGGQLAGGHVRLLGTGLWDEDNLALRAPALAGGWYAAPSPAERRRFIANYRAAFAAVPPRLATIAYDATALAVTLARRGVRVDAASLTNPSGFAGVDGIFRLNADGMAERGLAVNQVAAQGVQPIDPAPASFTGSENR
ncbi:MAG: penicillin-binding protein activator [Alphaproteobacteria bacterium]